MADKKSATAPKPRVRTIIPGVPVPEDQVNAQGYLKDGALERITADAEKQQKAAEKSLTVDPEGLSQAAEAEAAEAEVADNN